MKHSWLWLLFLSGIVAGLLLPLSPIYRPVPEVDQSVYLYVGARIMDGQVPYRDAWDHKQPITYFIYILGMLLSKNSLWGLWAVELALLITAAALCFLFLRRVTGSFLSFLAVAAGLFTLFTVIWGYSVEEISLVFQILALVLFGWIFTAGRPAQALTASLLLGGTAGILFFLKQSLVAAPLCAGVVFAARLILSRKTRDLAYLGGMAGGAALAAALVAGYLAANGALQAYWSAAFTFNLIYSNLGPLERVKAVLDSLEYISGVPGLFTAFALWLVTAGLVLFQAGPRLATWVDQHNRRLALLGVGLGLILLSLAGELIGKDSGFGLAQQALIAAGAALVLAGLVSIPPGLRLRISQALRGAPFIKMEEDTPQGRLQSALLALAVLYFPISVFLITLSGRDYVYYYIALIPVLIFEFGVISSLLWRRTDEINTRRAVALIAACLCAALAYQPILQIVNAYRQPLNPPQPAIADYIRAHTQPTDTILAWGKYTTYVYYIAQRKAPTRFFYQAAVAEAAYDAQVHASQEILRDIQQSAPTLFLYSDDPSATPEKSQDICPAVQKDANDALFQYICAHYQYQGGVGEFLVYRVNP